MNKESAIVPRLPYRLMKNVGKDSEKIVFLNDKNLEQFKGYKAYVQVNRQGEIHVTITGLSKESATVFFDNLKALDPKEIVSSNKKSLRLFSTNLFRNSTNSFRQIS